jgi:molybdopterin-guanine dinucleotide biosynthesis protein A
MLDDSPTTAAIILCGGKSKRMGQSKADLPFGPERMLQRVVRLAGQAADRVVVVAAADQALPTLADEVVVTHDRRPDRGPLEGLYSGMLAMPGDVDLFYATSCDVPLLVPQFVRRLFTLIGPHDIAVPVDGQVHHVLSAVYRLRLAELIERLLAADQRRLLDLIDRASTLRVRVDDMRDIDPQLLTLRNVNEPAQYLAALKEAGFRD